MGRAMGFFLLLVCIGVAGPLRAQVNNQAHLPQAFLWLPVFDDFSRNPALTGWPAWNALSARGLTTGNLPDNRPRELFIGYNLGLNPLFSGVGGWFRKRNEGLLERTEAGLAYRFYLLTESGHLLNLGISGFREWATTDANPSDFAAPAGEMIADETLGSWGLNLGLWYNYASFHVGAHLQNLRLGTEEAFLAGSAPGTLEEAGPNEQLSLRMAYYFLSILNTQFIPRVELDASLDGFSDQLDRARYGAWLLWNNTLLIGGDWREGAWRLQAGLVLTHSLRLDYEFTRPTEPEQADFRGHELGLQLNF